MIRDSRWGLRAGLALASMCLVVLLATGDRRLLLLGRNTFWLALGACAISVPLGTVVALLLARTDMPGRRVAMGGLASLLFVPLFLQASAWDAGFGKRGWYSSIHGMLGDPWLSGWFAAIWIQGLASLAWVALIVGAAVRLSEPELEEQALLDGTALQVFWHVTLRRALAGVLVATLWVLLTTVADMTVSDLYQIRTLAEELYSGYMLPDGARTLTPIRLWLIVGMLAGMTMAAVQGVTEAATHVPRRAARLFHLGAWRWPAALLVVTVLVLALGVPIGNLVYKAGLVVEHVHGVPQRSWAWRQIAQLLMPLPGSYRDSALWRFHQEFQWTLMIGGASATLSLVIAAPLAWWARRGGWRSVPALMLTAGGLATPGPAAGMAVVWLLTRSDDAWCVWLYDRTILGPVLAETWRTLPLVLLISWLSFRSLSGLLVDAAHVDGAGPLARLWHAGVRQRPRALATAWLVGVAVACGDLSAVCNIQVVPPGMMTVPIRVFDFLHAGVQEQVAAICLTSMAAFLIVAAVAAWTSRLLSDRAAGP